MKKTLLILLLFSGLLASNTVMAVPVSGTSEAITPDIMTNSLDNLKNLSVSDFETKIGKKLTLKEKLSFKYVQHKLKKFGREAMSGKTIGIIAHLTLVGWVIALVVNSENKDELASFYIRQTLGLMLLGIALGWIPIVGWILAIVVFIFFIISLIGAISGKEKLVPILGKYFQDWFSGL